MTKYRYPKRGLKALLLSVMMIAEISLATPSGLACKDVKYAFLSYYDGSEIQSEDESKSPFSDFSSILSLDKAVALCKYIDEDWRTEGIISGNQYWSAYFITKSGATHDVSFNFPNIKQAKKYISTSNAIRLSLLVKSNIKTDQIFADLMRQGIHPISISLSDYDPDGYNQSYEWYDVDAAMLSRNRKGFPGLCKTFEWLIRISIDGSPDFHDCYKGALDSLRKPDL